MKYLCNYCSKYQCTDDEHKLMFRCPEFSPKPNPMTNYDRLISKTPEELAKIIVDDLCEIVCGSPCGCDGKCEEKTLLWLKSQVEG